MVYFQPPSAWTFCSIYLIWLHTLSSLKKKTDLLRYNVYSIKFTILWYLVFIELWNQHNTLDSVYPWSPKRAWVPPPSASGKLCSSSCLSRYAFCLFNISCKWNHLICLFLFLIHFFFCSWNVQVKDYLLFCTLYSLSLEK